MQCPQCQHENPAEAKFCLNCGTRLVQVCAQCQQDLPPEAKFCMACGHNLLSPTSTVEQTVPSAISEYGQQPLAYTPQHLAEKILTSRSALEGERKQVTVVFCDLQNSTPLAENIGPEQMHSLLNRFFELALKEVHRYEGTINQFLGDGFMAIFGAPVAHEDHAHRAVLSAIGLQNRLKEAILGEPYGVECQFRIGINSGLVVVGSIGDNLRMDYSAIGDTTNLAARLQTQCEPGNILVSETTARRVASNIRLEALEPVEVKGKSEPVSIFKARGTLPRRSPIVSRSAQTLSEFVGRERELTTLEELYAQVESSNGQVVGIVAEAGQGKSRLLYEFKQHLQDKEATYLEGRCLSYGSSIPYHPIIDVIRNHCGMTEADSPEVIVEKIQIALQEVGMDREASAPYLLQLLGVREGTESIAMLTPEAVRTRTFDTLTQMTLKGSERQPLILVIDDMHWSDNTSQAYLSSLVESLAGAPVMLVMAYRPGYQSLPWLDKSYATQISLHSLNSQDAMTIVHSTPDHNELSDDVVQTIVTKAEGNPFFLEELTRAVTEHSDFQTPMTVPDTIQGVLSARIDRLPEPHKDVLQTASVLGREFSSPLLEAIWDDSGSLNALLAELKRLEFLYERTGTEEQLYVFKHALTQDVAYESLLTTRRQTLHAAAGQALEALYADRLEDAYDLLAYHYARTDNAAKAVDYLTRVGEKAAQGYAHAEAVTRLQEALVHAERLPEVQRDASVLELVICQCESLHYLGRRQELVTLLLRHQERLEQLVDPLLASQYYFALGRAYTFIGKREEATQNCRRAIDEAARCGDKIASGKAHTLLATEMRFAGQPLQSCIQQAHQAVSFLEQTEERVQLAETLCLLGLAYIGSGECNRATEVATRASAISEAIGDRRLETTAVSVLGMSYAMQGECEVGIETLQHALAIAPVAFEAAWVLGLLGYAHLEKGDLPGAIRVLELAVQEANVYRSRQVQCWFQTFLSAAYCMHGQIDEAHQQAHQALEFAQTIQDMRGIGFAQRILGRIAAINGDDAKAEADLQKAFDVFTSMQSRYEQARTALDLASLVQNQGNQEAATTHLNTAYAWFKKLQIPKWVERTEQLAHEHGVTLTEVELEKLETEGSS